MKTRVKIGQIYWRAERNQWDDYRGYVGVVTTGEFAVGFCRTLRRSRGKSGPSKFPPPHVLHDFRRYITSDTRELYIPKGALSYVRVAGEEARWDVFLVYPGVIPPDLIVCYPDAPDMASIAWFSALKWPDRETHEQHSIYFSGVSP